MNIMNVRTHARLAYALVFVSAVLLSCTSPAKQSQQSNSIVSNTQQPEDTGQSKIKPTPPSSDVQVPLLKDIAEFFPMAPGTRWVYNIEVRETDPITLQQIMWQVGNRIAIVHDRSRIHVSQYKPGSTFALAIKIKGPIAKPISLSPLGEETTIVEKIKGAKMNMVTYNLYQLDGLEIEIEADELHIFPKDHQNIVWQILGGNFEPLRILEIVTYSHKNSDVRSPSGQRLSPNRDGYSQRLLLFYGGSGTELEMERTSNDGLLYNGAYFKVFQNEELQCVHFRRNVASANSEEQGEYQPGFTEDLWYAEGKGLVRLEQKVAGKPSMIWTLADFSPGRDQ